MENEEKGIEWIERKGRKTKQNQEKEIERNRTKRRGKELEEKGKTKHESWFKAEEYS